MKVNGLPRLGEEEATMSDEYLIKNTTREKRERIVNEALGVTDGLCDGCAPGILKMYDAYIEGKMELAEVNAAFHAMLPFMQDMLWSTRMSGTYREVPASRNVSDIERSC